MSSSTTSRTVKVSFRFLLFKNGTSGSSLAPIVPLSVMTIQTPSTEDPSLEESCLSGIIIYLSDLFPSVFYYYLNLSLILS